MGHVFCTIVDKHFLFKGLTLYSSLRKHCSHFQFHVLCMDEVVHELLSRMGLPGVHLIRLSDIEDEKLLNVKASRTNPEYCWTCKPFLCEYVLQQKMADSVAYLDGDLFFFGDPYPMYEEIGDSSIAITGHHYPVEAYMSKVGRFNAGFVYFRNDAEGLRCIKEWQDDVIDWCFTRFEENRFADQFYLNKWPARFKNLLSIKHPGVNAGPWNIKYCTVEYKNGRVHINDEPLIFYHFQSFLLLGEKRYREVLGYFIPKRTKKSIYPPYIESLLKTIETVRRFDGGYSYGYRDLPLKGWLRDFLYYRVLPEPFHFKVARVRQKIVSSL